MYSATNQTLKADNAEELFASALDATIKTLNREADRLRSVRAAVMGITLDELNLREEREEHENAVMAQYGLSRQDAQAFIAEMADQAQREMDEAMEKAEADRKAACLEDLR